MKSKSQMKRLEVQLAKPLNTPRTDGMLERVLLGTATAGDVNHLARVLERELEAHRERANSLMATEAKVRAQVAELRAALRHIDGIAQFMAATGRDAEQWEQVKAHAAALAGR